MRSLAALVDSAALRFPNRIALISPSTLISKITHSELASKSTNVAHYLRRYGYKQGDLIVSNLSNNSNNLMMQIACSRLGVHYGSVKELNDLMKFKNISGAVDDTGVDFLATVTLPVPAIESTFISELVNNDEGGPVESVEEEIHAMYNSATPYSNSQLIEDGADAAKNLEMTSDDVVAVSISMHHMFGIGSAISSALHVGACTALPDDGEHAYETVVKNAATLLFADTHTLKADSSKFDLASSLRGGCVKIGSGSTFLPETCELNGIVLKTVGKMS